MKNTDKVQQVNLSELKPFNNHPFKIRQDDEMAQITESIREYGVITPALARPLSEGGYELTCQRASPNGSAQNARN